MSTWTRFWIAWLLIGVTAEIYAIIQPAPGDTISEQVWALRDRLRGSSAFSLILFLTAGLAAWAIYHFAYEGRR